MDYSVVFLLLLFFVVVVINVIVVVVVVHVGVGIAVVNPRNLPFKFGQNQVRNRYC